MQALAFELSTKGGHGCEPALRITYDDANESFVLPKNVKQILRDLHAECAPYCVRCPPETLRLICSFTVLRYCRSASERERSDAHPRKG